MEQTTADDSFHPELNVKEMHLVIDCASFDSSFSVDA